MTRFLRPDRVIRTGTTTWLLDESWAVALALPDGAEPQLMSWPRSPSDVRPDLDRVAMGDGVGIVVRSGDRVAWVRRDDVVTAAVGSDLLLSAADVDTAWLVDWTTVDPGRPPSTAGRILAVRRDGSRRVVDTPAPVQSVALAGDDVWVTLAEPAVAHPSEYGTSYEYPVSVLRTSRQPLLEHGLESAVRVVDDPPRLARVRPLAWSWLDDDPATVLRYGEPVGGLVWWVGTPRGSDKIVRRVVAVGHDPATGTPAVTVDLGAGVARDVAAVDDELVVTVVRQRWLAVPHDRGVDVLAVAATGAVRTVLPADAVDVSRFAPTPVRPPQAEIDEQLRATRARFAHLDAFWQSDDGRTSPLSRGLHDPSVTVDGEWPDTRLILTFRHPARPGLLLRRTLHLFDETGAANDLLYADIHLMEHLDTGYLAPADEVRDGVLDT